MENGEGIERYAGKYPFNGTAEKKDDGTYKLTYNLLDVDGFIDEMESYIGYVTENSSIASGKYYSGTLDNLAQWNAADKESSTFYSVTADYFPKDANGVIDQSANIYYKGSVAGVADVSKADYLRELYAQTWRGVCRRTDFKQFFADNKDWLVPYAAFCTCRDAYGTPDFTLETAEKADRGTDIILYLSDDSAEFAEKSRIESLLKKYCSFLPVPIAFGKEQKWEDGKYVDTSKDNIVNDTHPLWMQKPTDITEEQYTEFYHKLYPMAEDPLFHIHLNVDYPFTLTGILYFPKIKNNFEIQKNKIQLYSNQVYVTDSVEGIVPDFLTLLHGVIDSPDIPLNVSRSYLQSDSNVKKISGYITKKVADRLADLFKNSRSEYETKWDDLKLFIQYGIVSEEKFGDRAAEFTLLKNTEGKYFTFDEYTELIKGNQTDKNGKLIHLYSNDPVTQNSFIESARAKGYDVLVMDSPLEAHFISFLENKHSDWRFTRVDSDTVEKLIEKEEQLAMALTSAQQKLLTPVFESQLPTDPKSRYHVQFEAMDPASSPIIITQGEFMRRMKDMSKVGGGMYSFYGEMPDSYNVVVNGNHPLVIEVLGQTQNATGEALAPLDKELAAAESEKTALGELLKDKKEEEISQEEKDKRAAIETKIGDIEGQRNELLRKAGSENVIVGQLVDLALLANGMLKGEALTRFIKRSVEVVGKSAEKAN